MPEFWPYMAHNDTARSLRALTEVQVTDGEEFRTPLSDLRKVFEFRTYLTSQQERYRAEELATRVSGKTVDVAEWTQHFRYSSAIGAADTVLTFDTAHRAYAIGDRIVIWENPDSYVIRTVSAVSATDLTFSAPIGQDFARATLAPVWEANCIGAVVVNLEGGNVPVVSATFTQTGVTETAENLPVAYEGLGVLLDEKYVASGDYQTIANPSSVIDAGVGGIQQEATRAATRRAYLISLVDQGLAAMWRRDRWLAYLNGRTQAFWLPSPQDDLRLTANVSGGATIIRVAAVGVAVDLIGLDIIVNEATIRKITAVGDLGDEFTISLSGNIGAWTVDAPPSLRFLRKVRLAEDSVDTIFSPALYSVTTLPVIEVAA